MKLPKLFNKMKLAEQEMWLTNKLAEVHGLELEIRRYLAKVRGGQIIFTPSDEIDRLDEIDLKKNA
jgi:hypothetical protein